jgi:hypothetical protein
MLIHIGIADEEEPAACVGQGRHSANRIPKFLSRLLDGLYRHNVGQCLVNAPIKLLHVSAEQSIQSLTLEAVSRYYVRRLRVESITCANYEVGLLGEDITLTMRIVVLGDE